MLGESSQSWKDSLASSLRSMAEGMAAVADGQGEFAIEEGVVERDAGCVGAGVAEPDAIDAGPVDGGEAHGAGLAAGVDFAAVEAEGVEVSAGGADGFDFRVGGGVVVAGDGVAAFADDGAISDETAPKGPPWPERTLSLARAMARRMKVRVRS